MCTVTWTHTDGGYSLFFNRDELRTRPPEHPPRRWSSHGVSLLAPLDEGGSGSWIAANEHGLTAALLNHYAREAKFPDRPQSRGGIPLMAAAHRSVGEVIAWANATSLARYRPFYLVAVDPHRGATVLVWDGSHLSEPTEARLPVTTSSFFPDAVRRARENQFREWVATGTTPTAMQLEQFHRSRSPKGGAWSVWMDRNDACTRSMIRVDVGATEVSMRYEVAHQGYSVADGPAVSTLPRATPGPAHRRS